MLPRLYSVPVAATELGIRPATLRSWIADQRIEIIRIGRLIKVSEAEILRIISDGRQPRRGSAPQSGEEEYY